MVRIIYVAQFFCNLFGNPLRQRCNTFGISLVFVLFLLCPDVVATTSNRVEPVYDSNGKRQHCEAKYHFVFYVFKEVDVFFGFYLCYIHIDRKNALV
jgi:hypothetical protein